jgi:hypothetical protein
MKTAISPKIWAGANAAALVTLFITLLGALGPGSLDFLGHWAPLAYGVVAILVFAGAAYLKTDSLREAGIAAIQKAAEEAAAALEASKQTSLAVTAVNVPATGTGWQGDGHGVSHDAPVTSFAATQVKIDALAPVDTPVLPTPAPAVAQDPIPAVVPQAAPAVTVAVTPVFTPPAQ